jgi:branched-subunit amino acid aminotransferase/4-amino-4-deoxychorismate lyase
MNKPLLINFNGEIVSSKDKLFQAADRILRYGDGLFESMRALKGRVPLWHRHYQRLEKSAALLQMHMPEKLTPAFFQQLLQYLLSCNNLQNARIRFTLYRKGEGLYLPETNECGYLIEIREMQEPEFVFNVTGLQTGIYTGNYKSCSSLSNIKTNNGLLYVLASVHCKQQMLDECLIINQKGYICESMSSNVFILKEDQLITPSLRQGCIDGVMRKLVLELAADMSLRTVESYITLDDLDEAAELFFTNAVSGVRWASSCNGRIYGQEIASLLSAELNKRFN